MAWAQFSWKQLLKFFCLICPRKIIDTCRVFHCLHHCYCEWTQIVIKYFHLHKSSKGWHWHQHLFKFVNWNFILSSNCFVLNHQSHIACLPPTCIVKRKKQEQYQIIKIWEQWPTNAIVLGFAKYYHYHLSIKNFKFQLIVELYLWPFTNIYLIVKMWKAAKRLTLLKFSNYIQLNVLHSAATSYTGALMLPPPPKTSFHPKTYD